MGKAHEVPRTVPGAGPNSANMLASRSKAASPELKPTGTGCAPGAPKRRGLSGIRGCKQAPRPSPSRGGSRTFFPKPELTDPSPNPRRPKGGHQVGDGSQRGRGRSCPQPRFLGQEGTKGSGRRIPCRDLGCPRPWASQPWGPPRRQRTGPPGPHPRIRGSPQAAA